MSSDSVLFCTQREHIEAACTCPKTNCPQHGICCRCIVAHKQRTDAAPAKRLPHCLREIAAKALEQ